MSSLEQNNNNNPNPNPNLTSTTAPGKIFASRAELAAHYKTDWHKYNLKRREAGLPVLLEHDFEARLKAAQAVRQQQQAQAIAAGTDHVKTKNKYKNEKKKQNKKKQNSTTSTTSTDGVTVKSQVPAYDQMKATTAAQQQQQQQDDEAAVVVVVETNKMVVVETEPEEEIVNPVTDAEPDDDNDDDDNNNNDIDDDVDEMNIEIDPCQSLFDRTVSKSVTANVCRMHKQYGFFIPDQEYLMDLEGLIGYCHEKIILGHLCLYCHRTFRTMKACQQHMIDANHTKLQYEAGIDLEDLAIFYDFKEADADFLGRNKVVATTKEKGDDDEGKEEKEKEEEDGWEDVSDDEDNNNNNDNENDDDDDLYFEGYEEDILANNSMGLDVTPLGELVFPDGRIIGHRALKRYYQQKPRFHTDSTAQAAARQAAGERLIRGQVYNIGYTTGSTGSSKAAVNEQNALALRQAGIAPGLAAGRAGKGILVATSSGGAGGDNKVWSQLSIYRYRAAIRKQRREDSQGRRLYEKSKQNINRMDKKANMIMNGVSVARALR